MTDHDTPREVTQESFAPLDEQALEQITGGASNRRYWYYRAGTAMAGADPAGIASLFM
jgi:hypothetical protein